VSRATWAWIPGLPAPRLHPEANAQAVDVVLEHRVTRQGVCACGERVGTDPRSIATHIVDLIGPVFEGRHEIALRAHLRKQVIGLPYAAFALSESDPSPLIWRDDVLAVLGWGPK
jgi:hypothetical protein